MCGYLLLKNRLNARILFIFRKQRNKYAILKKEIFLSDLVQPDNQNYYYIFYNTTNFSVGITQA